MHADRDIKPNMFNRDMGRQEEVSQLLRTLQQRAIWSCSPSSVSEI